ncbi:hypothetical protein LZ554_003004 [Drepanopeziza brunnea f. sp. 'monogermtubi']|nr:hypothetical protein LZ554_003004 [Drepanopeziza brunnea f. sp. 'monogermtubi']
MTWMFNASCFLSERPRYLISNDRREGALDVLVTYHAQGDPEFVCVKAEMVQIETTIQIEAKVAKLSCSGEKGTNIVVNVEEAVPEKNRGLNWNPLSRQIRPSAGELMAETSPTPRKMMKPPP